MRLFFTVVHNYNTLCGKNFLHLGKFVTLPTDPPGNHGEHANVNNHTPCDLAHGYHLYQHIVEILRV